MISLQLFEVALSTKTTVSSSAWSSSSTFFKKFDLMNFKEKSQLSLSLLLLDDRFFHLITKKDHLGYNSFTGNLLLSRKYVIKKSSVIYSSLETFCTHYKHFHFIAHFLLLSTILLLIGISIT